MKLIAVGDLHGSSDAFLRIVSAFDLVDDELEWKAGDVHLIMMGDICDRGSGSRIIYELLIRWQLKAPELGSRISFIIGNHEVMNIVGYRAYNNARDYAAYAESPESDGRMEYETAFSPGGWIFEWLIGQRAVLKDGPFIFAHADLPGVLSFESWDEIDRTVMTALRSSTRLPSAELPDVLFSEQGSVLWSREAFHSPAPDYGEALEGFLERNGAGVYVCGHTPSEDGSFRILYNGHYLCIDTAMVFRNKGFGGVSALLYEDGIAYGCYFKGDTYRRETLGLTFGF